MSSNDPTTSPLQSPQMPRLGLLAAGCSSGRIVIYSLPHPDALLTHRRSQTDGRSFMGVGGWGVFTLCLCKHKGADLLTESQIADPYATRTRYTVEFLRYLSGKKS